MKATIERNGTTFDVDLSQPIDISIPLTEGPLGPSAWYVDPMKITPVRTEHFVGDVNEGGAVNFRNIYFNPHGNGTHTECVGHISKEWHKINDHLKQFFFMAEVISVTPEQVGEDKIIRKYAFEAALRGKNVDAVVVRTLPNLEEKRGKNYSNTNPPFLEIDVIDVLLKNGINHLLIDLPSVDKEFDDGALAAHHKFWNYPNDPQTHRTITEFIFVNNSVADGTYLLNIQIAPFENDASPSKPILYKILNN